MLHFSITPLATKDYRRKYGSAWKRAPFLIILGSSYKIRK
jgi:hypothetical protein